MMIVDDAYIIVGSANINERSLSGTRDTEMAVGCWQPQYSSLNPYGEVHMFRMSLWAEHLKTWEDTFRFPGTLECTRRVREMCKYNWKSYNFEEYGIAQDPPPPGHLLLYPIQVSKACSKTISQNTSIQVDEAGNISNLDRFTSFPDYPSTANIFGSKSSFIPEKVTT